jgi:hypothetical protein
VTGICFLDTETLGIHPDAPIWEFAAITRPSLSRSSQGERRMLITIEHDPGDWLDTLPAQFVADYHARYDASAWRERDAAQAIHDITKGAHIVACNPVFDDPRLANLLRRNGLEPAWHYHPDDISSMAKGYLAARGELPKPPWKSDQLSLALGVDPADYARHTAMGDALWCKAQYDAVMT